MHPANSRPPRPQPPGAGDRRRSATWWWAESLLTLTVVLAVVGAAELFGASGGAEGVVPPQAAGAAASAASSITSDDGPQPSAQVTAEPVQFTPTGDLERVAGDDGRDDVEGTRAFAVEVERGLDVDVDEVVEVIDAALFDERSWAANGYPLRRTDGDDVAFTVTLATPDTTDALCHPLQTNGLYSCWNGRRAVLNAMRWTEGAPAYEGNLHDYRLYVVNHEVGHALGYGHVDCPQAGAPAPVMMQQTKGIGDCRQNPFPFPDGRG